MTPINYCSSAGCSRATGCGRHPKSGVKPDSNRPSIDYSTGPWFEPEHCHAYLPPPPKRPHVSRAERLRREAAEQESAPPRVGHLYAGKW